MRWTRQCSQCLYVHNSHDLVCAVHPSGPITDPCPDFDLNPASQHINSTRSFETEQNLTAWRTQSYITLIPSPWDHHPCFTGRCSTCQTPILQKLLDELPEVWDCPICHQQWETPGVLLREKSPNLCLTQVEQVRSAWVLKAEADTYIRSDLDIRRKDNYGREVILAVGTGRFGEADRMRSLIRFDLRSFSKPVEQAILQLTVYGYDKGVPESVYTINIYRILEPWIEGNGGEGGIVPTSVSTNTAFGVCWSPRTEWSFKNQPQPQIDPSIIAQQQVKQGITPSGSILQWDITRLVNQWITNQLSNYGIMLVDHHNGYRLLTFQAIRFVSREQELFNMRDARTGPRLILTPTKDN